MIASILLRTSVILLLLGMVMGIVMGIRQDFALAPAHAHLNLVGFVLMFVAGLYYRLVPRAAEGLLAKIQAGLHLLAAVVFPLGIAAVLSWGTRYEFLAIVGAFLALAAMAVFAAIVYRTTALETPARSHGADAGSLARP